MAEIFIKTLKDKMYKYITSVSKNVYIDKVDERTFCPKNFLLIKRYKTTVPWTYLIEDLNGEKNIVTFYGKELQKIS